MRKIGILFLGISVVLLSFVSMPTASAQTLGDLRKELEQQEADLNKNKEEQQLTQEEMNATNAAVQQIQTDIQNIFTDIKNTEESIVKLNEDIETKKKQMKEIVNFVQVSNGESAYLEYAFGAKDFTDFIYRIAVSEQLTKYNEKLIDQYNAMIKENEQKKIDLQNKNKELSVKQAELAKKYESLKSVMSEKKDVQVDIEEQIKYQKELIKLYKDKGCGENDDIKTCGRNYLPKDTSFLRPIIAGKVSSEFGYRGTVGGIANPATFHDGIDFTAGSSTTTPVYSIANGMVSGILNPTSTGCGGKMVMVHHNINGTTYTSMYAHLLSINVSVGQLVTKDSVIGIQGGGPETWGWDACSTGYHVHLSIASGLYGSDYTAWSTFTAKMFNPRNVVNAPSAGVRFDNRYEKF